MRTHHLLIVFMAVLGPALASAQSLRVLFLGGVGKSHRSDSMDLILTPPLAAYGIELHYTEDPAALNRENLSGYAALYLFHELGAKILPEHAAALLAFVAEGKGVVVCHMGIGTAGGNPAVDTLFGARFLRHGRATFTPEIVLPSHPAMAGVSPFKADDETYEHRSTGSDRTVLMVRKSEGKDPEPWTWVRTSGKGRVYYTASGHGSNVWALPAFQKQIAVALRWAALGTSSAIGPALAIRPGGRQVYTGLFRTPGRANALIWDLRGRAAGPVLIPPPGK